MLLLCFWCLIRDIDRRENEGFLYSLVIFMHYRRNVTLGDSNFLGDQLETHLHFPLSFIIDIIAVLDLKNIFNLLSLLSEKVSEVFFLAFFSFLDDSILADWPASYGLFAQRFFMFDFEDRASPFSTGTHFLELLLQLFAEKKMERKFTQAEKTWKKDSSIKE